MIKTQSIKKDLIITLCALIALVLILVRLADFIYAKHHNKEALDANLVKSAKLIFGLIKHDVFEGLDLKFLSDAKPAFQQKIYHRYEYKLHVQAWEDDDLIYNSDNFLVRAKPDYEGFQDVEINDQTWRSFSFYDPESKIRILVAEKDFVTNQLILEEVLSFIIPLLFSFSLLFFIVVFTVNKKLKPLDHLANEIEKMSANSLQQFNNSNIPIELKPFIESFNSLIRRLVEAIDSERNFTNYAAHELKTPLAAIGIQAHLLISNKNKEKEQDYINDLLGGINRATHLINQLLTLARIESDNANITKEKFNLSELINLTAKNYSKKAQDKKLEIEVITDSDKENNIFGNKIYIDIIVGNLLDNAIKYSFSDKKILISVLKEEDFIKLKVANYGEQILPEEIEKIFGNFYRISRLEFKNQNVGCGLGLAIVKKIADLHQAKVTFSSVNQINAVEICFSDVGE